MIVFVFYHNGCILDELNAFDGLNVDSAMMLGNDSIDHIHQL